jgi:hypothetical protein
MAKIINKFKKYSSKRSFFLVLAFLFLPAASASATTVTLSPATTTVAPNQTFSVDVRVDTVSNLFDVAFHLGYDATKIQFVSATQGTLLSTGATKTVDLMTSTNASDSAHTLIFGLSRRTPDLGASTTNAALLARLNFKSLASTGSINLTFTSSYAHLYNPSIVDIPTSWVGATVNISNSAPIPVYRFRNLKNNSYLYTASDGEKANIIAKYPSTWRYEGSSFRAFPLNSSQSGTVPVYRLRNAKNGFYFYTADVVEKNSFLIKYPTIWKLENNQFNVYPVASAQSGMIPVYRFRNLVDGRYLLTANENEKNNIIATMAKSWVLEGVKFRVPV